MPAIGIPCQLAECHNRGCRSEKTAKCDRTIPVGYCFRSSWCLEELPTMHCCLAGFSCRGVDAVRRFPYLIVVIGVAILLVLGSAFFYFRPGGGDAVSTPSTDVEAAAAITAAPPVSLSTMAEAVPIVTETPRILSTAAPAESGVEPPPAAIPTAAEQPPPTPLPTVAEASSLSSAEELLPTPLPTLAEAVMVVTETPRVLSTVTPANVEAEPTPTALPTLVEVASMYSTGIPDDTAVELPAIRARSTSGVKPRTCRQIPP